MTGYEQVYFKQYATITLKRAGNEYSEEIMLAVNNNGEYKLYQPKLTYDTGNNYETMAHLLIHDNMDLIYPRMLRRRTRKLIEYKVGRYRMIIIWHNPKYGVVNTEDDKHFYNWIPVESSNIFSGVEMGGEKVCIQTSS